MKVYFTPEQEARFRAAVRRGIAQADRGEFVEEEEMDARIYRMIDSRYDDLKSGKVKPIDGEEAFERLMQKTATQRNSKA